MKKTHRKVWKTSLVQCVVTSGLTGSRGPAASGENIVSAGSRLSHLCIAIAIALGGSCVALSAAAQEASQTTVVTGAGQGIFVNDGSDSACSEYTDNEGVSNLASDVHCLTNDKATQTNRVLFYNPRGSVGSTSLTLGGELYVNSGNFGLGGGQTGALANSMRIGGATTLATTNSGNNSIAIGGASNATTALGSDSVAVGSSANAQSANGIAIGNTASAQSGNDIAIGAGAVANANIGNLSTAGNTSALAAGNAAQAYGNNATALGINAIAGNNNGSTKQGLALGAFTGAFGDQSTAIGNNAQSMGNSGIAMGGDDVDKVANTTYTVSVNGQNVTNTGARLFSLVTGSNAIAAGTYHASQAGDSSVALGPQAQAGWSNSNIYPTLQGAAGGTGAGGSPTGEFDVAIGTQANAAGFSSIAMGTGATASADTSVAMGVNARASGVESIAFGTSTLASQNYALAIGNGGTSGATYTQATGIGALAIGGNNAAGAIASGANAIALGGQSSVAAAGTSGIAVGRGATVNSAYGIAQGDGVISGATGQNVAIGSSGTLANANTPSGGAVAIGMGQSAIGNGAVAIGDPNTVNGDGAVAMGANNSAAGSANGSTAASGAVAIGNGNSAIGQGSVALGNSSNAAAAGALAFGDTAVAQAAAGVALGSGATATHAKDVALGASSITSNISAGSYSVIAGSTTGPAGTPSQSNGVVSVGSMGHERQIQNVAAGTLSSTSTDVVNGSQLYAVGTQVNTNTANLNNLGSNTASYLGGGAAYNSGNGTVSAPSYVIGGSTYNNAGAAFAALNAGFNSFNNGTAGIVQRTSKSNQVVLTASGGTPSNPGAAQNITNVAEGALNSTSTDAVDGSQLYATNQAVGQLSSQFTSIASGNIKYVHTNSTLADSQANGTNSMALGPASTAATANAVAIGNGATASANTGDVALGGGSTTAAVAATNSVTVGGSTYAVAGTGPTSTVSVGSVGNERTVTNVAGGQITATSTDAVNGSELYATNQAVNANTASISALGSQVANLSNGNGAMFRTGNGSSQSGPAATGSNSVAGGAGSVASGNNSLTVGNSSTASGSGSTAVGTGASATASNSVAIGANSVADRADSVSVGSAGNRRQVTNVAAGTAATDAVNVSQLNTVQAASVHYDTNLDGSIDYDSITLGSSASSSTVHNVTAGTAPTDAVNVGQLQQGMKTVQNWAKSYTDEAVNHVGRQAFAGVASAIAAANLPQAYQPNQSSAGVALGNFHGQSAVSVGVSTISESGRWIFKANASTDTRGDAGVGVGAGVVW